MKSGKSTLDHSKFQELYDHQGSENYEVVEIVPKQNEADYFELDTISENVFINSFFEPKLKKREGIEYNTLKLDVLGNQKDSFEAHSYLKDGTMWNSDYYVNWLIKGDTVKYRYIDPFSKNQIYERYEFEVKEKNPEKWLAKFKDIYSQANYVYVDMSNYYFKVVDKWYFMKGYKMGKANSINIKKQYPPKEDQDVRMLELQDLSPEFYLPPEKRETSLMKEMEYESAYFEEVNEGLNQYNYSAGW